MNTRLLTKMLQKTALASLAVGVVLILGCDAKQQAPEDPTDTVSNAQTDASNQADAHADDNAANSGAAEDAAGANANGSKDAGEPQTTDAGSGGNSEAGQAAENFDFTVFGIKIGQQEIHLRDKQNKEAFVSWLGEPLKEENIEQAGDGFTGSVVKKLIYEGITVDLFAPPPDEGKEPNYWVLGVTTSSEQFKTTRDIAVGNTIEELLKAYPEAEIAKDGRVDESSDQIPAQYAYQVRHGIENELRFEIDNGQIVEIRLMYWIP